MRALRWMTTALLAAVAAGAAFAQPQRVDAIVAELVAESEAIVPGTSLRLGLRLVHDPQWHSYWRNPGDSGLPTRIELDLPPGFSLGPIEWPAPKRLFVPPLANYGYDGEVLLPRLLSVPSGFAADSLRITGKAYWLVCRDVCIPGEADVALTLPVQRAGVAAPSKHRALFEATRARTPTQGIEVAVDEKADRLSLIFPAAVAGATPTAYAEFFPYNEASIANAAPQRLYRIEADRLRLEVERVSALGATAASSVLPGAVLRVPQAGVDAPGALVAAEGVLILDGRPFEVRPTAAAVAPAAGSLIATVAGAPATLPDYGRDRGLVSRFLEAAGIGRAGSSVAEGATGAGPTGSVARADGDLAITPVADTTLALAVIFALVGGVILNLMPCVFPIVGLKILGFAGHGAGARGVLAPQQRRRLRRGALAFSAGVLVSFWLLAGMLLGLREIGEAAGWGFQLQSPSFVAGMALLFMLIALNLSGIFEVGNTMTRLGEFDAHLMEDEPYEHHRLLSSFGSGVLAVLVATPCTAPFMGSALGFTLSQPAPAALAVFSALGVGMALPYLLLGFFPAWLRLLPKPGRWMESFKELLAFPMYAAAAWLAWVLGRQTSVDAVFALVLGALVVALGAWVYGRFVQLGTSPSNGVRRRLCTVLALALVGAGGWIALPGDEPAPPAAGTAAAQALDWQPWSQAAVAESLGAGRAVFVDFTADWCISCQVNKKVVLERDEVVAEFNRRGVRRLRGDWTRSDPAITAELARHGRNGVPLYLLYVPGEVRARILPEILTVGIVKDALAAIPPR